MDDKHSAPTGSFEKTMERVMYKFADNVYIHDCPGIGTPKNPAVGYFLRNKCEAVHDYCLFGGATLSEADVKLAKQLAAMINDEDRFPMVRSQCDKDLRDMKSDGEITQKIKTDFRQQARKTYFDQLPGDVQNKVYLFLISAPELLKVVRGEQPGEYALDEKKFWRYFQEMAKVNE